MHKHGRGSRGLLEPRRQDNGVRLHIDEVVFGQAGRICPGLPCFRVRVSNEPINENIPPLLTKHVLNRLVDSEPLFFVIACFERAFDFIRDGDAWLECRPRGSPPRFDPELAESGHALRNACELPGLRTFSFHRVLTAAEPTELGNKGDDVVLFPTCKVREGRDDLRRRRRRIEYTVKELQEREV